MSHWLKMGGCVAALAMLALPLRSALAADATHPTVVELFQSQGCSSCPPAAASVSAVSDRADVLALSFAVDYWDRLGWKDTFSKHAWTERQYAYARALARDGVYTPQVVVNGRVEGDALELGALAGLMSRGDRGAGGPNVGFSGGAVTVGAGAAPSGGADVWLARYIPRTVEVAIRAAKTPATRCPIRTWCARWSFWANGAAKRRTSPCRVEASKGWPRRRLCRARAAGRCWPPPGAERARERADQALFFKLARDRASELPGNFTAKCGRHALAAWTFAHRCRHNSWWRTGRFLPPNKDNEIGNRDRTGSASRLATIASNRRMGA